MVFRVFKALNRELVSLHGATMVLATSAIASGLLGLFRDRLMAGTFGAGRELDIYYAAFRVPDFLYILSISLVSVTVLVPLVAGHLVGEQSPNRRLVDSVFTVFALGMVVLSVAAWLIMPRLAALLAPGFSEAEIVKLTLVARILLASPFFLGLSNLFSSVAQSYRRFLPYALAPIFYNLGIIAGILLLSPQFGVRGVAYGVAVGSFLHAIIQVPILMRLRLVPSFTPKINWRGVRQVVTLSIPRSVGLSVHQILLLFITAFASLLPVGSIAVFNLAFNLQSVPLSVIGVSFAVAAFPTLARLSNGGTTGSYVEAVRRTARSIIFWAMPATVFLIVLRAHLVRVVFGYANFSWADTRLTAAALALFALSLAPQMLIVFFSRAYYAAGETIKPIAVNVASTLFIAAATVYGLRLLNAFPALGENFAALLRVADVPGTSILVLPLAFSLGAGLNAAALYFWFKRSFGVAANFLRGALLQGLFASLFLGLVSYFTLQFFGPVLDTRTVPGLLAQGAVSGLLGGLVWGGVLYILRNEELLAFLAAFRAKLWRRRVLVPEPTQLP